MDIPIFDGQILKLHKQLTEMLKMIVEVKEDKSKLLLELENVASPIVKNEYVATWSYTIISNVAYAIRLELKIFVECRKNSRTYTLHFYAYTNVDEDEFSRTIEIPADIIADSSSYRNYLEEVEEFIENVLDYFIEEVDNIALEVDKADIDIVDKIKTTLKNKFSKSVDEGYIKVGYPVYKCYKYDNVLKDKILEGELDISLPLSRVLILIEFTYYICNKKLIINGVTIRRMPDKIVIS